jgi:hypothetical protein
MDTAIRNGLPAFLPPLSPFEKEPKIELFISPP